MTDEEAFRQIIENKMRELALDMEWNLLHVESTVASSPAEWDAKPGWKKWLWRRWWAWRGFTWRQRYRIARWIYPFTEEED